MNVKMRVLLVLFLIAVTTTSGEHDVSGLVDELIKYFLEEISIRPLKEVKMPDLNYNKWYCSDGWLKKIHSMKRVESSIITPEPDTNSSTWNVKLRGDFSLGFNQCEYPLEDDGSKRRDKMPALSTALNGAINSTIMEFDISLASQGKECVAKFDFYFFPHKFTFPAPKEMFITRVMHSDYMRKIERNIKDFRHKPCKLLRK